MIFEKARFNQGNKEGETAENYITQLYMLAEHCNFGEMRHEMFRDRLVVGIRDTALSRSLQLQAELTLEKAKKKIWQQEVIGEQQKQLNASATESPRADVELICSRAQRPFTS